MKHLTKTLVATQKTAVFIGACVSTLCGIPDFRGPQGLYSRFDAGKMFDIGWFYRDPEIYYKGCREIIYRCCFFRRTFAAINFWCRAAYGANAPLMLVLGSSLAVQPAATIPEITACAGGKLAIINAQPTPLEDYASFRHGDLR